MTTFAALGCSEPYLAALEKRGFTSPTPVQAECFQPGLDGRDLLVQSRTGSGKTLAFGLPLMHRLHPDRFPQALILTPTRELAQQVAAELSSVCPQLDIAELVGGMSYGPQLRALKFGARVIVGTPGRTMDHLDQGSLDLSQATMVVLDECDEMLNMGFLEDVEKILSRLEKHPQTFLFSATLPDPIAALAQRFLQAPHRAQLTDGPARAHADIAHTPCLVAEAFQSKALVNLLLHDDPTAALVFTKTKAQTEELAQMLREAGLSADHLHGDLAQNARNRILTNFKTGKLHILVATDVAARGIDIEGLPLVVHLGIPTQLENYIHRSGRTGRAGAKGTSLALVGQKESRILMAWGRRAGLKLDWRPAPTQAEIRKAKEGRLADRLAATEDQSHRGLAERLLAEKDATEVVAALLSLVEDQSHAGFVIPEPRDTDSRPSRPFKPRAGERSGWSPDGPRAEGRKPFEKKPFEKKPFERKPWSEKGPADREGAFRGPRREEDRSFGPRKPFHKDRPAFPKRRSED
nr:DEAD/DEAH box helicase [uncultured Holophaga sp.]